MEDRKINRARLASRPALRAVPVVAGRDGALSPSVTRRRPFGAGTFIAEATARA
jgi:hypothetical protein